MSELQKDVILTLAGCDMNICKTGRKLYMHRNTVEYHLGRVKEATGLDPHSFYDLIVLVKMAEVMPGE